MPEYRGKKVTNARVLSEASPRWKSLTLLRTLVDDRGVIEVVKKCPGLQEFAVESTLLTDVAIQSVCRLSELRSLMIFRAPLVTDLSIPFIGSLPNLRELYLDGTKVTDRSMNLLQNLSSLWSLSLSRTGLTDTGVRDLVNLPSLKLLRLNSTGIRGKTLVGLPNTYRFDLYLEDCPLEVSSIIGLATTQTKISLLSLNRTPLDDSCMTAIAAIEMLGDLRVEETSVSDLGISALLGHPRLCRLYLSGTFCTEAIASELKNRSPNTMSIYR